MLFRQALTGVMQLFIVLIFFGAGFFSVCLPSCLSLRLRLVKYLLSEPSIFIWIGLSLFSLTFLFTLVFYLSSKGRYLLLAMNKPGTEVNIKILKKTIDPLFSKHFGSQVSLTDIEVFKKRHLCIGLSLSEMEQEEREKTLSKVEIHLQTILAERFGYHHPFTIQVRSEKA